MHLARFPRVRLAHLPTPLEPAPGLSQALGIDLWIKRDDCTGLAGAGFNPGRRPVAHRAPPRSWPGRPARRSTTPSTPSKQR
jgi:hypothetical protein